MATTSQFGRVCELIVGDRRWSGSRVSFSIKRTLSSKPNQGQIAIYNLTEDARTYLEEPGLPVTLIAGYRDAFATIFAGQVWQTRHHRGDTEIVSTIAANDGTTAYLKHLRASWAKGTPKRDVVKAIAEGMGLAVSPATLDLVQGVYSGPRVVAGPAAYELDLIANTVGLQWSIQNGALALVPIDDATHETEILLSRDTGLVGWPEVGEHKWRPPGKGGKPKKYHPTVKAVAKLDPQMRPGVRVELRSVVVSGRYRADVVEFDGDTHEEGKWTAALTLRPLQG